MELTTFQPWERRNAQDEIIRPGTYGKNTALTNGQNTGILDYIGNNLDVLYAMASGAAALTWQAVTNYTADTMLFAGKGLVAVCTQAGRSGTTAPEWQEGEVEDGTVLWQVTNFVEALGDIYTHINTTALHVNSVLKEKWNNHVDDDDIHVTEEEKNAWNEHLENAENPHEVTKEQVGLGNVDNTSDLDKPISAAAQAAFDSKLDIAQGAANAGKPLIVGNDGNVKPINAPMFNKRDVITTSGTYTAPVTGWYKITVKGGGGGGSGGYTSRAGGGGAEGGTYIGYHKLTAGETVTCVVGAGGAGNKQTKPTSTSDLNGGDGGASTVTINAITYTGGGGGGYKIDPPHGAQGGSGTINGSAGTGGDMVAASGAGNGGEKHNVWKTDSNHGAYNNTGGGGCGAQPYYSSYTYYSGNGGSGYIWFEYFDPTL